MRLENLEDEKDSDKSNDKTGDSGTKKSGDAASKTDGAKADASKTAAAKPAAGQDRKDKKNAKDKDDPNAKKGTLTVATANDLVYEDNVHRATYTTDAHVVGEQGDLKADKVELYLDESGKGLQRLEAYTKVWFNSKTLEGFTRRGTGTRLTYFSEDGRYVMSGTPSHVQHQMPQECRESTGQTLTFFRPADSVTVDGNAETRTQTKTSGTCPELTP